MKKIKRVLTDTYKSTENDGTYDASWKKRGGKEITIKKGSIQEKQIADFSEHGVSLHDITCILNEHLLQDAGGDLEVAVWFTKSAVEGAFNRMKKIEVPMSKRAQGSTDKNSHWAMARHRFIVQMQVCMGDNPDLTKFIDENGDIPHYFRRENLSPVDFNGTAFWEEFHRECHTGDGRSTDSKQFKFFRNENGDYDEEGTVRDKTATYCTFKFNKQV